MMATIAGLLIAFGLFAGMAMQAPTTHAAASSSHWVVVHRQTFQLPKATCDRIKAISSDAATAHSACEVTSALMVLQSNASSPYAVCGTCGGGGGTCTAHSKSWLQYYEMSTLLASYYYQQSGTFTYDGCHVPTDSGHNCTRQMSYSPGVSVSNTYCGDYSSGGKAYAEGDYLVAVLGIGSTSTLVATCDSSGNIHDPSLIAD
jgi:hypothetical protein